MEHPVRADDVSDILYEGTEIGLFFRDYGWVCRYSVDGEEFAAVADFCRALQGNKGSNADRLGTDMVFEPYAVLVFYAADERRN